MVAKRCAALYYDCSMRAQKLSFRSGGWVLLLAAVLTLLAAWPLLRPVLRSPGARAIGDGTHVESYGFDLTNLSVSRTGLAASGLPRDGIPTLDRPTVMPGRDVAQTYRARKKYLVPDDEVIGVVQGGEARAYPLRVLNWHEIVNDVLGGKPIAVTYSPLSDGTAVFDGVLDGKAVEFGVSGLLYNSNLVMYDRGDRSLWSQLRAQAIAGVAVGTPLRILPCARTRWGAWLAAYPDTTVLRPDPAYAERYRRDPYGNYVVTGRPRFPVDPMPPPETVPMTRVMAWRASDLAAWQVTPLHESTEPPHAETLYAFWFAWYAVHEGRTRLLSTGFEREQVSRDRGYSDVP